MKIVYVGKNTNKRLALLKENQDVIVLLWNDWDDFNYKTTFSTYCQMRGREIDIGSIQILFENKQTSFQYLDELIAAGWDGIFPVPNITYISTPQALSFYEQIDGHLGNDIAIQVAEMLFDASYFSKIKNNEDALRLVATDGFKKSLQREHASVKAFLDGWKLLGGNRILIGDLKFQFKSTSNDLMPLNLKFTSLNLLPHDINVLIGPNGVGKSQLLQQMVKSWLELNPDVQNEFGFSEPPNLNQMVVVSYSPFELFPVDTSEDADRQDHGVYKYFGMRGRQQSRDANDVSTGKISLGRQYPKINAAKSLLACLADDQKYGGIKEWANKVATLERVLRQAFQFDRAAIAVSSEANVDSFFTSQKWIKEPYVTGEFSDEDGQSANERYVPIASDRIEILKIPALTEHLQDRLGVIFLKDGRPIQLSSGQRLFSYIVINILGAIRRNSLILVDEPELFLHPSLEIAFIRMLKSILTSYASKALVATHSLVTVREIPRNCVHVFEQTNDGVVIKKPPFETFGGDVQRISSYVFGDKSVSKPYEDWLREQLAVHGSPKALIQALGDNINEELIIEIHALGEK